MTDSMFLYPRDLVEIYDQEADQTDQLRSHVVGCSEVNGIEVISDFYSFLVKNGIVPQPVRAIPRNQSGLPESVLMDNRHDKEFYVTCRAGEVHRLLILWSQDWRARNGYSDLPLEAQLGQAQGSRD